ncbi:MAG: hypothetical protein ABFS56_11215 [Pseudomonadota bacterium]
MVMPSIASTSAFWFYNAGGISSVVGDQMHWQRAYAIKGDNNVIKTFMLGAFFFVLVPVTLSLLGFVGASSLSTVDLVRGSQHSNKPVLVARIGMLATAVVGLGIPGLQIVHLFWFYGIMRVSSMIPTVLSLFWDNENIASTSLCVKNGIRDIKRKLVIL